MPSIQQNYELFNDQYLWEQDGDEWSDQWESVQSQWEQMILPRLSNLIPAKHILEIAPGHGRWTQFLLNHCDTLSIVDLSDTCIEYCKKRFQSQSNINFNVNDGKTLTFAGDSTIDLVFSFDSLVHVERNSLDRYIEEIARVLKPGGMAFLHHSNTAYYKGSTRHLFLYKFGKYLQKRKLRKKPFINYHWRADTVSHLTVQETCERFRLNVLSQEIFAWPPNPAGFHCDCISVIGKGVEGKNKLIVNRDIRQPFLDRE